MAVLRLRRKSVSLRNPGFNYEATRLPVRHLNRNIGLGQGSGSSQETSQRGPLGFICSLPLKVSLRLEVGGDLTAFAFLTIDRRGLRVLSALFCLNAFFVPNTRFLPTSPSPLQPEAEFCRYTHLDAGDQRERNVQSRGF